MDWKLLSQWTVSMIAIITIWVECGFGHEHGHGVHGSAQEGAKPTGFHDPKVVQDAE